MQLDILICAVPSRLITKIPGALPTLKACVQEAGLTARTVDFNIEFFKNQCSKDVDTFNRLSKVFEPRVEFEHTEFVANWLADCIAYIKKFNPRWVGISVETPFQHRATILLAKHIREHAPEVKIVMGAYGLDVEAQASLLNFPGTTELDRLNMFDAYITKHRLADKLIFGDGENALVELLTNTQVTNLFPETKTQFTAPIPDFDDIDFFNYAWATPSLPITGSKSCVRSCTFCSVPHRFGKFRSRTGEDIANELIALKEKYQITRFDFTDSLVNGSQKVFFDWASRIADYNDTQPRDKQITWTGQYICKPQKSINPEIYPIMKRSGCYCLIIGAESGSDDVLAAMKKMITVQDLYDELEQLEKHKLQARFLMLSGFYNETWDNFIETLEFMARCHKFVASGTLTRIAMGIPLHIEHGITLNAQAAELGITLDPNNIYNWKYSKNPESTFLERVRRRIISHLVLEKMSVPMTANGVIELHTILELLKEYEQKLIQANTQAHR